MKVALLVSILTAVSTAAYFSGRIYLLLSEHASQAVIAEQHQQQFWNNGNKDIPWPTFQKRGL